MTTLKLQYSAFKNQAGCIMRLKIKAHRVSNTSAVLKPFIHDQNLWHLINIHKIHHIKLCVAAKNGREQEMV